MLKLLRSGKAAGVMIHKIDRSARNMKDWAELGELIDGGIEVHFVNESLDLASRGGRLSADIQAVVAADYIRNLRDETRKGFYGRIKQGLYPLPAPIGYIDTGKGKPKELDPVRAPLENSTDATLKRFKVALVDPNLSTAGNDLCGLKLITRLPARSGCRTVLMTGETGIEKKLREFANLLIYGYIDKPFTMDELLDELVDAVGLENPLQLQFWIRDKDAAATSAHPKSLQLNQESRQPKMQQLIDELGRSKPGVTIHLFELHPRSWRATSIVQFGKGLKWEPYKGKIAKSVIKDTAQSEKPIVYNRVKSRTSTTPDQQAKGHLWTLEMIEYQSFCGVSTDIGDRRLALVSFHPLPDSFDQAFVSAAELCLERLAREVERNKVDRIRQREAILITSGMAIASLAHELTSDVTVLDAYLVIVEGHVKKGSSALNTLDKFRTKVAEVGEKVKILRGAPGRSDHISLLYCLRKAVDACRAVVGQTIPNPERILIQDLNDPGLVDWLVAAPAGSLIIVIFNLLLNAAQQIDYASGVRRYGKVWPTVTTHFDRSGMSWVRLRIHDTGPGIHRDDWDRVFDPGYSTRPEGSGLGLHICRHLLKSIGSPGAEANVRITVSPSFGERGRNRTKHSPASMTSRAITICCP